MIARDKAVKTTHNTEYTSNGNYVARSVDDRGYATKYSYDPTKGTLGSVETPNGGVTKYTYNANNDRLEKVTSHDSASGSATTTVRYAYSSQGDLSGITTPSTAYTFTYDAFGNPLKTAAGGRTLVTNTYQDNNGNLASAQYGNGLTVNYGYDSMDRLSSKSYGSVKKGEWVYNAAGQLWRHWDFSNGRGYIYSYDALGRPTRVDCTDGNWLQYGYNTVDQSTFLRYHFDGVTRTTSYTLSADCLSFLIKSR